MAALHVATRKVPGILVTGGQPIEAGTPLEVAREFWRNGEGWVRLSDGRELPDVFVGDRAEYEYGDDPLGSHHGRNQ